MIIKPKTRGFICTTTHPVGCEANVKQQIEYTKSQDPIVDGPKRVLVVGSSSGYGLSSRIAAAFGSGAAPLVSFLKNQAQKLNPVLQVGTIQQHSTNLLKQKIFIQKVLTVMHLVMKQNKKQLS